MNEANDSKFVTRKWNIVNDNSKSNYGATNEITHNTEVLKSSLRDSNDADILVRGDITNIGHGVTQVAFKNCIPFTKCITKIDETTKDDAENLDLDMPMYNLTEYSPNYPSFWFYSKEEATDFNAGITNNNSFNFFEYKAKL